MPGSPTPKSNVSASRAPVAGRPGRAHGSWLERLARRLLPAFLLRRVFTPERLAACTDVTVRARGEQVTFNLSGLPTCRVWLMIGNRNPFDIELDRMVVSVWYGAKVIELYGLDRIRIEPRAAHPVFLEAPLGETQVGFLRGDYDHRYRAVNARAYFDSAAGRFGVFTRQIEAVRIELTNVHGEERPVSPCPTALH